MGQVFLTSWVQWRSCGPPSSLAAVVGLASEPRKQHSKLLELWSRGMRTRAWASPLCCAAQSMHNRLLHASSLFATLRYERSRRSIRRSRTSTSLRRGPPAAASTCPFGAAAAAKLSGSGYSMRNAQRDLLSFLTKYHNLPLRSPLYHHHQPPHLDRWPVDFTLC